MKYVELEPTSRAQLAQELDSGDRDRVSTALVQAALHDHDRCWLEDLLATYLEHSDPWIRGVAATCTGHVARIHGDLDLARMLPLLRRLLTEEETLGRAEDALSDIDVFVLRPRAADDR